MIHSLLHRIYIGCCLLLAACCLEACHADSELDSVVPRKEEQTLVINLSTQGDRLTTRAGRPLHSSEARQEVHHLTIYVLNNQGIVLKKQVDHQKLQQAWEYAYGKQLTVTFRSSDGEFLPQGNYTFYAVAFSRPTDYQIIPDALTRVNAITALGTIDPRLVTPIRPADFEQRFAALLGNACTEGEEIFAGKAEIMAGPHGLTYKQQQSCLILNRQVAGVMGYFTNIPTEVNGMAPTSVRLVASNKNNQVHFYQLLQGETQVEKTTYVVNGSRQGTPHFAQVDYGNHPALQGYVVYDIPLADFFPALKDGKTTLKDLDYHKDGHVGYQDIAEWKKLHPTASVSQVWTNPRHTAAHPQSLVQGSIFDARFVIPFRWKRLHPTFELQLMGRNAAGQEVFLKAWNVRIADKQLHVQKPLGHTSTGVVVPIEGDESTTCFNVYRNHFYALGTKSRNFSTSVVEQPSQEDRPLDLSRQVELVLTIQKQWSGSENMGIN